MKTKQFMFALAASSLLVSTAYADAFTNGGFEAGTFDGWNIASSARPRTVFNDTLTPQWVFDNAGSVNRSQIISKGTVDAKVGTALGDTVYAGNYSARIEDTKTGGYASAIRQQVNGYDADSINFVWKAVLQSDHGPNDAATFILTLKDLTDNTDLVTRQYNAASTGAGVDNRFVKQGAYYYTPDWQIETIDLTDVDTFGKSLVGHDFLLELVASDCEPTAHMGYVYLDGFGGVAGGSGDDTNGKVPEPATLALFGLGLLGMISARRRETIA